MSKLEYFWLGLVFAAITHVSHVFTRIPLPNLNCCPRHNGDKHLIESKHYFYDDNCPNGLGTYATGTAGTYCKPLNKCFARDVEEGLVSIPCKKSDSEDYSCSNQTAKHKVCRGTETTVTACRK